MKPLAFVLLALVGSLILTNLPAPSYADPNLDTLLRIATQARDNINIQLSQLPTVPDEINQLYKQGSEETDALAQSVSQEDQPSSKSHFLSAMRIFKELSDKISSLTPAVTNEQATQIDTSQLNDQINRMQKLGDRLRTIAINNNVEIDFTKFNETMQDARQNLDAGNRDQVNNDLETANQFLLDAHHILADAAIKKTPDRAKDFTKKQIERLSQVQEPSPPQSVIQPITPPVTPPQETTNATQIENTQDMIVKLRQLVSEGKIDEALKLIKMIEAIQNQEIRSQVSTTETPNATQPANVNNINTPEITNPANNSSTITQQNNQTKSETENTVNATQNDTAINNPPHIDNEKRFHEKRDNQTQSNTSNAVNATHNAYTVNDSQHHVDYKKRLHEQINKTDSENKDWKKIRAYNSGD